MSIVESLTPIETSTVTDRVFHSLYTAIITLDLSPGTKVSEADIAKSLGVSRQPVRDAFYRLSNLGFLTIRPQRATTISFISVKALLDAVFVRTALEVECIKAAIDKITDADILKLEKILDKQLESAKADERLSFHGLDNKFHETICEISGHVSAWTLIRDQKVHMERIRYLSLEHGALDAQDEHRVILKCLKDRNKKLAEKELRSHLMAITHILDKVKANHTEYFE